MSYTSDFLKAAREEGWRVELRQKLKGKERTDKPRVAMPEVDPNERIKYQNVEVNTGLVPELAMEEASR